jgi:hypothetical protein
LSEAAADFRAFVVHAPAKAEIECQHYPQAFSYPPTYEEALAQAPEFATKVIEAVNISSGDTELSPLKHYGVGVGRAIGFISLVTAKIASGESSTSI